MGLAMVWRLKLTTDPHGTRLKLLLLASCTLCAAGCQHANPYRASSLPPQFAAPHYGNLDSINLSQLAQSTGNSQVLGCSLSLHTDEDNPRNRNQSAYVNSSSTGAANSSCRVGLATTSTNGIRFAQFVQQSSPSSRTFSVTID